MSGFSLSSHRPPAALIFKLIGQGKSCYISFFLFKKKSCLIDLLILKTHCFYGCFACMFVCVLHAWYPQRPEEGIGTLGTGVRNGFELQCECRKLNLGPLEGKTLVLTAKPSAAHLFVFQISAFQSIIT